MNIFYSLLLSLFLLNASSNAKADISVDSVYLYQIDSQNSKDVYLVLSGLVLPYWCYLSSTTVDTSYDSVVVKLCYNYPGVASHPCNSYDTIFIGSYSLGEYAVEVDVNAVRTEDSTCANPTRQDTFYLSFSVVTGLNEVTGSDNSWRIFPNPSNDYITINSESEIESDFHITITAIDGRLMEKLEQPLCKRKCSGSLDISRYPQGVYVAHVATGDESKSIKLLKY